MTKLFFDIETLPCEEAGKEIYLQILKDKHAKKNNGNGITEEELFLSTAFDGTFGRICCIGYIKEDSMISLGVLKGNEKEMLEEFWNITRNVNLFVGHNILDFDFPFLYKRSIIHKIKPRNDISLARYRSAPVFDTQKEWEKWSGFGHKMDTLAKVLGLPTSKGKMDGASVWPYFQQGKMDEICNYCMKDVELVRKIYYRMNFEQMPLMEGEAMQEDIPF